MARGSGRVMEEGYWFDKNPGKTTEDYNEMLLYHGGRGGDISGGNYVPDEDGVPRNSAGEVKPGWRPSAGQGIVAAEGHKAASGNLRRTIQAKKTLITGGV